MSFVPDVSDATVFDRQLVFQVSLHPFDFSPRRGVCFAALADPPLGVQRNHVRQSQRLANSSPFVLAADRMPDVDRDEMGGSDRVPRSLQLMPQENEIHF